MTLLSIHGRRSFLIYKYCKQIVLTATGDIMFHSWGHMIEDEAF